MWARPSGEVEIRKFGCGALSLRTARMLPRARAIQIATHVMPCRQILGDRPLDEAAGQAFDELVGRGRVVFADVRHASVPVLIIKPPPEEYLHR